MYEHARHYQLRKKQKKLFLLSFEVAFLSINCNFALNIYSYLHLIYLPIDRRLLLNPKFESNAIQFVGKNR